MTPLRLPPSPRSESTPTPTFRFPSATRALLAAIALAGGLFSATPAAQAQSVSTVPVGAMTYTLSAGTLLSPSTNFIAIPLKDSAQPTAGISSGVITSFSSTTITVTGAGWITNELSQASAPWGIRILNGASEGRFIAIASNLQDTITLSGIDLTSLNLTPGVTRFELVPIDTLMTLFGSNTLLGGPDAANADVVYVYSGGTFVGFFFNNSPGVNQWRRAFSSSTINRNDIQISPESGLLILRRSSSLTLTFTGSVPTTSFKPTLANTGTTFIHTGFPTSTTLGQFSPQTLVPNWRSSTNHTIADQVGIFGGGAWILYHYNGTAWRRSGSSSTVDRSSTPIDAGVPILIFRPAGISGNPVQLVRSIPYNLN